MSDLIDRQAALKKIGQINGILLFNGAILINYLDAEKAIEDLPSAQSERDIPVKPIETIDKAWGIPSRKAVCPRCDYYLGHITFLGDYKGKRITYCEICGQAIDWEGWKEGDAE